jgi:hypothetical protein
MGSRMCHYSNIGARLIDLVSGAAVAIPKKGDRSARKKTGWFEGRRPIVGAM